MKSTICRRILASLLLVSIIAIVSGGVGAVPPNPKEYARNVFEELSSSWDNKCKTDEAKKIWDQKYSKANVEKILNDLGECASDPEAREEVAHAIGLMNRLEVLDCLEPNEITKSIKTLFLCQENKKAEYPSDRAISGIIERDFMKKFSSEQIFQMINISQKYDKVCWFVKLIAGERLLKNFSKEQALNLLDIVKKECSDNYFKLVDVVQDMLLNDLSSELPSKQVFDLIEIFRKGVNKEDFCGASLKSFAQTIELMAQKHILKGLGSEQILNIIKDLMVCSDHTIGDEIEAEARKNHGCFSNLSYLNAISYGFSNGDAARSAAQKAIGFMVKDGLFDGFKPNQISEVLTALRSCLICEISGAKSSFQVIENIKFMAERGLFSSLGEKEFCFILDVLDDSVVDQYDQYYVTLALNAVLESAIGRLTPAVEAKCQYILDKCRYGYDNIRKQILERDRIKANYLLKKGSS